MKVNGVNQNTEPAQLNSTGDRYVGTAQQILKRVQQDLVRVALDQGISKGTKSSSTKTNKA